MFSLVPNEIYENLPLNTELVNMIRGKSLMYDDDIGKEIRALCKMIDWLEYQLDEQDEMDRFGTEGWRRAFGLE